MNTLRTSCPPTLDAQQGQLTSQLLMQPAEVDAGPGSYRYNLLSPSARIKGSRALKVLNRFRPGMGLRADLVNELRKKWDSSQSEQCVEKQDSLERCRRENCQ